MALTNHLPPALAVAIILVTIHGCLGALDLVYLVKKSSTELEELGCINTVYPSPFDMANQFTGNWHYNPGEILSHANPLRFSGLSRTGCIGTDGPAVPAACLDAIEQCSFAFDDSHAYGGQSMGFGLPLIGSMIRHNATATLVINYPTFFLLRADRCGPGNGNPGCSSGYCSTIDIRLHRISSPACDAMFDAGKCPTGVDLIVDVRRTEGANNFLSVFRGLLGEYWVCPVQLNMAAATDIESLATAMGAISADAQQILINQTLLSQKLTDTIVEQRGQLSNLSSLLNETSSLLSAVTESNSVLRSQVKSQEDAIAAQARLIANLSFLLNNTLDSMSNQTDLVRYLNGLVVDLQATSQAAMALIASLQQQSNLKDELIAKQNETIEALKARVAEDQDVIASLRAEVERLQGLVRSQNDTIKDLTRQVDEKQLALDNQTARVRELQVLLEEKIFDLKNKSDVITSLESSAASHSAQLNVLAGQAVYALTVAEDNTTRDLIIGASALGVGLITAVAQVVFSYKQGHCPCGRGKKKGVQGSSSVTSSAMVEMETH